MHLAVKNFWLALIFFLSVTAFGAMEKSADKPLYEWGVAGGGGLLPDYPASDQSHPRYIAVPTFRYRGKIFRADDEEGVGARMLRRKNMGLDVSAGGSFPAQSSDNEARAGMPDLDWLGEIGPRLYFKPYMSDTETLKLNFPARAAFSTNFNYLKFRGIVFAPGVSFEKEEFIFKNWTLLTSFTVSFASKELMSYFYSVDPDYVTPKRRGYDADAGYIGSALFTGIYFELGDVGLFTAARYHLLRGATNAASPLFRQAENWMFVLGIGWTFYRSEEKGYD